MTGTESSSLRTTTASTRIKNTKTRTVLKTSERPVMSTSNSYSSAREALATETPDMTSVSRSIFVSQSTEPVVSSLQTSTKITVTATLISDIVTDTASSSLETTTASTHVKNARTKTVIKTSVTPMMSISKRASSTMSSLALSSFSSTQEAPSTETPKMTAVSTAISPSTQPNLSSLQTSTKTTVTATTTSDIMTGTQFSTLETSTSSSHVKNTITNPTTTGTIITTQVSTISASSKRPTTTTTTTTKTSTVTKSTTREPLRGCSKADISVTNAEPDINMAVVPAGTLVQFSCVTGQIFQSGSTRKNVWCFNTEWQTPSVTCVPISCGSISKENAVLSPNRTEYVYGDEIEVTCAVGYSYPNGSKKAAINCTESGDFSYSTLHECEVVRCPSPPNVTLTVNNASTTGPMPYGTVIAYNCTENRTYADGSESRSMFCADNGKWSKVISGCLEQAVVAPVPRKRKHNPEPKEATGAIGIGAVGLSVVCGLLGCILALDISTLGKHLRLMKRNLGFRIQRKKAHRQPMELI
ncbi:uncharacterized protein DDB_G0271670 [Lingula anatina]|uniref:Uncharacterized protein DDB_G0271670 n=1 Tax=Lingula anatina TaxID=7574 RepID=A0A1S3JUP7_LINAN|nr:uncharacterized protein DDB_G0271670 [Lingula anatina]|eukprot:XP_013414053.1 uncharacterized protein DDB_G0271670 [Lingula anatina]